MTRVARIFWIAHASRVLVSASRRNKLSLKYNSEFLATVEEVRDRGTRSPARETRALPRLARTAGSKTSCIKVDLPLPEIPVITESLPTGKRTSMPFKLLARAPRISIQFSVSRSDLRDQLVGWQSGVLRQRAVSDFGFFATSRKVPVITTSPPWIPARGPRSIM